MKKDIILIGMPGCGKSTIGKILANELHRPFLDLDAKIEELAGKKINDIFATDGEQGFREMETKAFAMSVGESNVIATGGGIVTIPHNREIAKNGIVVFVDRPLEVLLQTTSTEERPLLKDGVERLKTLYRDRYALYCQWGEVRIENTGTVQDAVKTIIKEVERYENHGD